MFSEGLGYVNVQYYFRPTININSFNKMSDGNGMVTVNLNGLLVQVDLETAECLNKSMTLRKYYEGEVRAQLDGCYRQEAMQEAETAGETETSEVPNSFYHAEGFLEYAGSEADHHQEVLNEKKMIWSSKKPTPTDVEATYHFLELRKQMADEFNDKKNCKNGLWQKIANGMNEKAYYVGKGSEAVEKCRKKFSNLQGSYVKYMDKRRKTGTGKVPKIPYFDEIDAILGNKDKVNPQIIIDSIHQPKPTEHKPSVEKMDLPSTSSACSNKENTNKFGNIKSTVKPPDKNKIMGELVTLQKKDMEERRTEFDRMMNFLERESVHSHEQVMALLRKENKEKKRKRGRSDSDSE